MRAKDNGYVTNVGRPRKKPWERKATVVLQLEHETEQRIRRFAKENGWGLSQAAERLFRTDDAERMAPTLPVDYSHILNKTGKYSVAGILNMP